MEDFRGLINSKETFGTVDGPGIRYVQFLQGCALKCLYCHNPDIAFCPGGHWMTVAQTVADVKQYRSFIRSGGVTFSGGEPLLQAAYVEAACRALKKEGFHTAIDTSGSEPLEKVRAALDAADLVLLDIKAWDSEMCRRLTGRGNENALATLDYLESTHKPVWIRHVLLHGYTLDNTTLAALAKKLAGYSCVERVELLPFHKLGEPKWEQLRLEYQLASVPATTKTEAEAAREIFRAEGLLVQ